MDQQEFLQHKQAAARFVRAVKIFLSNRDYGPTAKWMLAGLIALLLGINGMNVVNNYVGRDFMTAIENRNHADFIRLAFLYLAVFAGSTLVSVFAKYLEDRLGLHWRKFITQRGIGFYLANGVYYRLEDRGELQNPDERIAEDIRAFTVTTLSFMVIILNSSITILAFSYVVLSISPLLFLVAVVYAAFGSLATFYLGRPLARLNYQQLDKEANFRSTLIHVRENAESLMLAHREGRFEKRLLFRLDEVVANLRKIINVNRNLGFFIGGFYWLVGLIPALIVAPDFMAGKIAFGVVTQSAMAFSTLVGAFSLVVSQFQSISNFTAVSERLYLLVEAFEQTPTEAEGVITFRKEGDQITFDEVSLASPEPGQCLLKNLTLSIPSGKRVLVKGPNEAANMALFKAMAGIEVKGKGLITRPVEMHFLAERPYLPPGTLRELLVPVSMEDNITDDALKGLISELEIESNIERAGGLGEEQDWDNFLSLAEQQLLAFIHILLREPRFVLLDRPDTALSPEQVRLVLNKLNEHSITYLNFSQSSEPFDLYNAVLEIDEDGQWKWKPTKS